MTWWLWFILGWAASVSALVFVWGLAGVGRRDRRRVGDIDLTGMARGELDLDWGDPRLDEARRLYERGAITKPSAPPLNPSNLTS